MKSLIPFLILCLIATCNAELRTWTSIVGTKVEAELVSLTGNQVTLKTKAGKTRKLPINKLSKADQEFLTAKSSPKEPTKEAPINLIKYKITGDEVAITGYDNEASGALTIPATIEGKTVTSIGFAAIAECRRLTSVTIGAGVTSIGNYAFSECRSLTSVTIGAGVTSIGNGALYGCKSLDVVTFLGDAPKVEDMVFNFTKRSCTIYRKPEAKGWGDTFGGRPVKLISEKP